MKKFFGSEERALFGCSVGMKKDRSKQREGSSRGNTTSESASARDCEPREEPSMQQGERSYWSRGDCHRSR